MPFFGSVAGLAMGYHARGRIRNSRGQLGGEGVAQSAIILGWLGLIILLVLCFYLGSALRDLQ